MRSLSLGIVAHVDAGKTTLTERLLYETGVIDEIGSVDAGNTQTDVLALERQRGITIRSAVVSFVVDDVAINLIDTPGHPDFIAEVERALAVLDGAVLVVSAVEGVQPQTRTLMRTLQRLRIPTLLFVNKIDRAGAGYDRVLEGLRDRLTSAVVAMGAVHGLGTRAAGFTPYALGDVEFGARLAEVLADHDEAILAAYVDEDGPLPYPRLRGGLVRQARRALVHPVFFGSAITGAGVPALVRGITELLPAAEGDRRAPVSGTVFKVERGPAGEKVAYVRMFAGTVHVRDRVTFGLGTEGKGAEGKGAEGKVTALTVFDGGAAASRGAVAAGQIGKVWGLDGVQVGDPIGAGSPTPEGTREGRRYFAPPSLETVVAAREPADRGRLHLALTQLAEQDPLINLRQDDLRHELSVSLYGEVQKEVLQQTLAADYGVDVAFRETTTICVGRPVGSGTAVELMGGANPFRATVGLRVDPAPVGTGVEFGLGVERGAMPHAFFAAVEEAVTETLRQGLHGWQVTDCAVTMTHSGYVRRRRPGGARRRARARTSVG